MAVDQFTNIVLQVLMGITSIVVLVGTTAGIIWLILKNKRYDYFCKIYEYAGNNQIILRETEKGGIFVDNKTKYKRFWLKHAKVGLSPDKVPYLINHKGRKVVQLVKDGTKSFRYLDMRVLNNHKITLTVTEEDVNWATTDYERVKKIFQSQWLQQILPYIGLILMGVFILGIIAMLMKDIKEILPILQQILAELVLLKSGTTIIQ